MAQEQEGISRGTETEFRLRGELLGPNPGKDEREAQEEGKENPELVEQPKSGRDNGDWL